MLWMIVEGAGSGAYGRTASRSPSQRTWNGPQWAVCIRHGPASRTARSVSAIVGGWLPAEGRGDLAGDPLKSRDNLGWRRQARVHLHDQLGRERQHPVGPQACDHLLRVAVVDVGPLEVRLLAQAAREEAPRDHAVDVLR